VAGDGQRTGQLVTQRGQLAGVRPGVRDELRDRDRLAGLQLRAHREPGVVRRCLPVVVHLAVALDVVVRRRPDQQAAAQRAVDEGESPVGVVLLRVEGVLEQVVGGGVARHVGLLRVGDEPGLHDDLGGRSRARTV
jgi:hypothetical protein